MAIHPLMTSQLHTQLYSLRYQNFIYNTEQFLHVLLVMTNTHANMYLYNIFCTSKPTSVYFYKTIFKRLISAWKVGLPANVRCASVLISSLEQSLEMRTSSHRAPPIIMSFAFASAMLEIWEELSQKVQLY